MDLTKLRTSIPCAAARRLIASSALTYLVIASGPSTWEIVVMNVVNDSLSWPRPSALIPATIVGLTMPLGIRGNSPDLCKVSSFLFKYGTRNSTVNSENRPPSCCSSSSCVRRTSSAVVRSLCLMFKTRWASSKRFSNCWASSAAVRKSAVLPTWMTPISSGRPWTMAPLPACAIVAGLVELEGDTVKITFAAAAEPSTSAWESASNDRKSPKNSSTLPRP